MIKYLELPIHYPFFYDNEREENSIIHYYYFELYFYSIIYVYFIFFNIIYNYGSNKWSNNTRFDRTSTMTWIRFKLFEPLPVRAVYLPGSNVVIPKPSHMRTQGAFFTGEPEPEAASQRSPGDGGSSGVEGFGRRRPQQSYRLCCIQAPLARSGKPSLCNPLKYHL